MNPLVRLDDVSLHFTVRTGFFTNRFARAVDGVSLTINRGEILALIGESGSGKTTLGRLTLRTVQPTAGRVEFDGKDLAKLTREELTSFRRSAQAVFQDPYSSLDPFMNVFQTLEEPLKVHHIAESREREEMIRRSLEEVRLVPEHEFVSKYPYMLSGGQRQRVSIARALMLRPAYVVADEPVSMVDVSSRAEILELLRGLQLRYGLTVLYITHDIATARILADRVAVMYLGRIVETGPVEAVVREPLHPYTSALIDAVPEPDPSNRNRERSSLPGEQASSASIPRACRFHPRCRFFMSGKCDVYDPQMIEVRPGRFVACHLYPDNQNN